MITSASKARVRYPGPCESCFWLSNQNSRKYFVVAAQITGAASTDFWRAALNAVQRHWALVSRPTTAVPVFLAHSRVAQSSTYLLEMTRCNCETFRCLSWGRWESQPANAHQLSHR
jgi:hypothetical protein